MTKLVITDLDNTLYDWVTYFARSFRAMVHKLADVFELSEDVLLDQFRELNQVLGTVEHPYSVFLLPVVRDRFANLSSAELRIELREVLHAFNEERDRSLKLYPGVATTLDWLNAEGVTVVGHTEASVATAYYRLIKLGIASKLRRVYVLAGPPVDHPDPVRLAELQPPDGAVVELPVSDRKPNPDLVRDICAREHIDASSALYVGDSLVRDVAMAQHAGLRAGWARYGLSYSETDWQTVVRVTHWTQDAVARDVAARQMAGSIVPDYVLESFADVQTIVAASNGLKTVAGAG